MAEIWDDIIVQLKDVIKEESTAHSIEYDEFVDIRSMIDTLRGIGMRKDEAVGMIKQIHNGLCHVTREDERFMEQVLDSQRNLSHKQADWLNEIYARCI